MSAIRFACAQIWVSNCSISRSEQTPTPSRGSILRASGYARLPSTATAGRYQRIIVSHELGHAVLHRKSGVKAFHDIGLFDESSLTEKEANLFAAEYLLDDEKVLNTLNRDTTFFSAAAKLLVPVELLDFKFRVMKWKGYKLIEPPDNLAPE